MSPTSSVAIFLSSAFIFVGGVVGVSAQSVHRVAAGGDLQGALNAAQPGDTITLAAGATYVGNFVLPAKSGGAFITIRSEAADDLLPPPQGRMHPGYAPRLPVLRSPNTEPALRTAAGAHHYRLMFLEFAANANGAGDVIALGDGSSRQNTVESVPYELIVDRVYVHGDRTVGQKRGIGLNSASTTIINSYIAEIKAVGQDSQAIGGWNGPGPYTISNNYLEAAGENVMFGGADPWIAGLVPSDITFTGNHLSKPLEWRGSQWSVKNLFELKNAQRVVVHGNLFENNWAAAQTGYAILLKSVNQDGRAPWSVVQQVSFTNNVVRNVSSAISILGRDQNHAALEANRITIRNNLFTNISGSAFGGSGRLLLINGGAQIVLDHNTAINDGASTIYADGNPVVGFEFTSNVVLDNSWAVMGSGTGEGNSTLATYFPGGIFTGNLVAGANAGVYPVANFYPSLAGAGFEDYAGGNYRLSDQSPYKGAAANGTDPGVDFALLYAQSTPPSVPVAPVTVPGAAGTPGGAGATGATGAAHYASAATTPENTDTPHAVSVTIVGATVRLEWQAPAGAAVDQYLVEAGSTAGAADVARVMTGSRQTSLVAQSVPNGRYYVRVRAMSAAGVGAPSADATFVVGQAAECGATAAPSNLAATVTGGVVRLLWTAPVTACPPSHYVVLAGSSSGLSNLAQAAASGSGFVASAPPGSYFVRVIAMTGAGASQPSNEIVVTVKP